LPEALSGFVVVAHGFVGVACLSSMGRRAIVWGDGQCASAGQCWRREERKGEARRGRVGRGEESEFNIQLQIVICTGAANAAFAPLFAQSTQIALAKERV